MNKLKLTRGIKIIVLTLMIIIIGIIISMKLSDNTVMAKVYQQGCTLCGLDTCDMYIEDNGSSGHYFYGFLCGRSTGNISHSFGEGKPKNGNGTHHEWWHTCTLCDYSCQYSSGACVPDSNSNCKFCGSYTTNTGDGSGGGDSGGGGGSDEECQHSFSEKWVSDGIGNHLRLEVCSYCGVTLLPTEGTETEIREKCVFEQYTDCGDGKHRAVCTICEGSIIENHQRDYSQDDEVYIKITDEEHTAAWPCISPGCGAIIELARSRHTMVSEQEIPATCTEDGHTKKRYCNKCQYQAIESSIIPAKGHNYEDGTCTECGEEEPLPEIEITSTTYKIEETYIFIQPSTKVSEFKSNISTNATEIKVYGNDEEVSDDAIIGIGMTLELKNEELSKTFTIIVKGDVNSDGEADFKDLVKINKARLNKITLEEIYFLAADVNNDAILDIKDLSKVNRYRLNKISEL